jgi:CubicO group peptidase (beta-lactamase class C family)
MLTQAQQSQIDRLFEDYDRPGSPGCSLGIIHGGQLVYGRGYGLADLAREIPNTTATAFGIGSESKQFTAACIALLADEGRLGLDDDVRRWAPAVPQFGPTIAIQHLVHHTSGLPDYYDDYVKRGLIEMGLSQEQLLDFALGRFDRPDFVPGERCSYSNTGYLLLAAVVEKASGMPFSRFLQDRILAPLGMTRTLVRDKPDMDIPGQATPYVPGSDGGFAVRHYANDIVPGDGKMYSTVDDLLLWDRNFYHDRLGRPGFVDLMLSPGRLNDGRLCRYAFGLDLGEFAPATCAAVPVVTHGGAHGGFESIILRLPARQLSVILLCNVRDNRFKPLAYQIAGSLAEPFGGRAT